MADRLQRKRHDTITPSSELCIQKIQVDSRKANAELQKDCVERYQNLKAEKAPDDPIYFMEVTHPQHNPIAGYGWIRRDQNHGIPGNTGWQHININGTIDCAGLCPVIRHDDTINTQSTVALLQQIKQQHPTSARIFAICDNGRYYRHRPRPRSPGNRLAQPVDDPGITLRNRIVMSPMCQYVATEGLANDWHLIHLGSRAVGGVALVMVEATDVSQDDRISSGNLGIWAKQHVEPLARIARVIHSQGTISGTQLAHAGRKARCEPLWMGGVRLKTPARCGLDRRRPQPGSFQ